jgi:subtilisin-like proprotein convertase family protein
MKHIFITLLFAACTTEEKNENYSLDILTADFDGDGYTEEDGDCNDNDPTIAPNILEVCDEIDNNCNDEIDEGVTLTIYRDNDGDTYGTTENKQSCEIEEGWTNRPFDCDDNNPNAHNTDSETVLNTTLDMDCDGVIASEDCDDADPVTAQDMDCDGVYTGDDCDDTYPNGSTLGAITSDADCDGILTADDCNDGDDDSTYKTVDADCDDILSYTYGGDDCDDDNPDLGTKEFDFDCDGYLNSNSISDPMAIPEEVEATLDCNDFDANFGSYEIDADCDGILNFNSGGTDCDDENPNAADTTFDADCDGYAFHSYPNAEVCISIHMTDSFGDGWGSNRFILRVDGHAVHTYFVDSYDQQATNSSGNDVIQSVSDEHCFYGKDWEIYWESGSYIEELGFDIAENETVVSSGDFVYTESGQNGLMVDGSFLSESSVIVSGSNLFSEDCNDNDFESTIIANDNDCDGIESYNAGGDDCDDNDTSMGTQSNDNDCDGILSVTAGGDDCDDLDTDHGSQALDNDCDYILSVTAGGDDCDDSDNTLLSQSNDVDCDRSFTNDDCDDTDNTLFDLADDNDCDRILDDIDCNNSDPSQPVFDQDCDGVHTALDCNDIDINLGAMTLDQDCDGVLSYAAGGDDCDDFEFALGTEVLDNDCDGTLSSDECDDSNEELFAKIDDQDCDGIQNYEAGGDDCDDNREDDTEDAVNPYDQNSTFGSQSLDSDCDGILNEDDCGPSNPLKPVFDADCDDFINRADPNFLDKRIEDPDNPMSEDDPEYNNFDIIAFTLDNLGYYYIAEETSRDCDDGNPTKYPFAVELCDGLINNCDEELPSNEKDHDNDGYVECTIDENGWMGYEDQDEDGVLDFVAVSSDPADESLNSDISGGDDCNETDGTVFPGADELCDGLVNLCGGTLPDDEIDNDEDGYVECTIDIDGWDVPSTMPTGGDDCDDTSAFTYVGAAINHLEDCMKDSDADGEGDANVTTEGVIVGRDCDDSDNLTNYGISENFPEECLKDHDGDGFGDSTPTNTNVTAGTDCNDDDIAINSDATEIAVDGVDQNCDGKETCFRDLDEDGFGTSTTVETESLTCSSALSSNTSDDCDDDNIDVNPNADEECDGIDNDCDSLIDETPTDDPDTPAIDTVLYYLDEDLDGFGTLDISAEVCPENPEIEDQMYVNNSDDCDDNDASILNDCDGDGFITSEDCDDTDPTLGDINDCDGDGILNADDVDEDGDGICDADTAGSGNPNTPEDPESTYEALDVPSIIPNNNEYGFASARFVTDSVSITSLDINLGISHSDMGEITVKLTSPNATELVIYDKVDSGQENFSNYLSAGSTFDGEDIQGTWILTVIDSVAGNSGTLDNWSLLVNAEDYDSDCDGTLN